MVGRNGPVDFLRTSGQHSRGTQLGLQAPQPCLWSTGVREGQRHCHRQAGEGEVRELEGLGDAEPRGGWRGRLRFGCGSPRGWAVLRGGLGLFLVLDELDLLGKVTDLQ